MTHVRDDILRVGLTGGIGAGKSTVSALLAAAGAVVIDADLLAREVVAPGTPGLAEVVAAFGPDVAPGGTLDRAALAAHVFGDESARRRLEGIVHPRVRARAAALEAAAPLGSVVVHDIPLLVETGQAGRFDVVVVVDAPEEVQLERLRARGVDEAAARSRIAAQATRDQRRAVADVVLDNSGTLKELREQVDALWADLAARATARRGRWPRAGQSRGDR